MFVRGFGGDLGILHIYKTADYVEINGDRGNPIRCIANKWVMATWLILTTALALHPEEKF